jgi:2-polyprenyl-3-methyl-5-hydroxy-6-metoxy-1,4-benzoquinol methylase
MIQQIITSFISTVHMIQRVVRSVRQRLQWLAGKGRSAEEFVQRYAQRERDTWAYDESKAHLRRREMIMAALGERTFTSAVEVGCAEGFLTVALASRAAQLVACDLAPEAVRRTRDVART